MEFLKALFSQGWISPLIGIIGLIIAFLLYRASRIGPRPAYQLRALRLIGKEEPALPEEVEILFRGRSVPRLTMTHIILWNSGKATLEGKNIIVDDPLRLEFNERAEVLRVRVLRVTRKSNKFTAKVNSGSSNEVICDFDYLDAGDGAVIELLHTAEERYPKVQGTIRGVPKGLLNWGRFLPSRSRALPFPFKTRRIILFITLFFGVLMVAVGFLYPITEPSVSGKPFSRWFFVIFGLIYASLPLLMLWITRRRFPKSLVIEDIEE
jgi:hypothetical protein